MHSGVAQWLACWAHNPKVRGSKPRSATFLPRRSRWDCSLTTTIPFLNQSGNHSSAHSCKFSAIHHHAHVYLPSMAACQSRCRIVVSTCMAPCQIRCSIVVSISACHAEDPGSIPGGGVFSARIPIVSIPAVSFGLSCAVDPQDHFPAAGWCVGGFGCGLLLVSHLVRELAGRHSRVLPCRTSSPTPQSSMIMCR